MEYTRESIRLFAQSYKLITVYKGIFANPVGRSLQHLLDLLSQADDPDGRLIEAYCEFFAALAKERADVSLPGFLIEKLLCDCNTFTQNPVAASNYISDAILTDLECIQAICTISAEVLRDYLRSLYILTAHEELLPLVSRLPLFFNEVNNLDAVGKDDGSSNTWCLMYKSLIFALEKREAFVAMLPRLRKFHETAGSGIFCRYPAAYFAGEIKALKPEFYPKDYEFFDYNGICVKVIENTARFIVHGERNNVLLTGPACLGKTTTLRLLPEQFVKAGYRYLELCPEAADREIDFAKLLQFLQANAAGNLKIVLALLRLGSAGTGTEFDRRLRLFSAAADYSLPSNCLIYASYDGDLSEIKEKIPLLHKYFKLQMEFKLPNQEEYLAAVYAFAKVAGFEVNDQNLTQAALTYAKQKKAFDLDVARDFLEVWRCMQNDQLTMTYDKVQAKQKIAELAYSTEIAQASNLPIEASTEKVAEPAAETVDTGVSAENSAPAQPEELIEEQAEQQPEMQAKTKPEELTEELTEEQAEEQPENEQYVKQPETAAERPLPNIRRPERSEEVRPIITRLQFKHIIDPTAETTTNLTKDTPMNTTTNMTSDTPTP